MVEIHCDVCGKEVHYPNYLLFRERDIVSLEYGRNYVICIGCYADIKAMGYKKKIERNPSTIPQSANADSSL